MIKTTTLTLDLKNWLSWNCGGNFEGRDLALTDQFSRYFHTDGSQI